MPCYTFFKRGKGRGGFTSTAFWLTFITSRSETREWSCIWRNFFSTKTSENEGAVIPLNFSKSYENKNSCRSNWRSYRSWKCLNLLHKFRSLWLHNFATKMNTGSNMWTNKTCIVQLHIKNIIYILIFYLREIRGWGEGMLTILMNAEYTSKSKRS